MVGSNQSNTRKASCTCFRPAKPDGMLCLVKEVLSYGSERKSFMEAGLYCQWVIGLLYMQLQRG